MLFLVEFFFCFITYFRFICLHLLDCHSCCWRYKCERTKNRRTNKYPTYHICDCDSYFVNFVYTTVFAERIEEKNNLTTTETATPKNELQLEKSMKNVWISVQWEYNGSIELFFPRRKTSKFTLMLYQSERFHKMPSALCLHTFVVNYDYVRMCVSNFRCLFTCFVAKQTKKKEEKIVRPMFTVTLMAFHCCFAKVILCTFKCFAFLTVTDMRHRNVTMLFASTD